MKHTLCATILTLGVFTFHPLNATVITYFGADFENSTLGGGVGFGYPFATPVNVQTPELDGRGLSFSTNAQAYWRLSGSPSNLQYVGFDFFALSGANLTMFLDVPWILRTDVRVEGRHRLDVFYDLSSRSIEPYLDGISRPELLTFAAWPSSLDIRGVRISNQVLGPGNSKGTFQIDNFLWQGGVTASDVLRPKPAPVPDTGNTIPLMAIALMTLGLLRMTLTSRTLAAIPAHFIHGFSA